MIYFLCIYLYNLKDRVRLLNKSKKYSPYRAKAAWSSLAFTWSLQILGPGGISPLIVEELTPSHIRSTIFLTVAQLSRPVTHYFCIWLQRRSQTAAPLSFSSLSFFCPQESQLHHRCWLSGAIGLLAVIYWVYIRISNSVSSTEE